MRKYTLLATLGLSLLLSATNVKATALHQVQETTFSYSTSNEMELVVNSDSTTSDKSTIDPIVNTSITIYPNPDNGNFVVEGLEGGEQLILTDMMGEEVEQFLNPEQNTLFDLELDVPKGIYSLSIYKDGEIQTEKVILK